MKLRRVSNEEHQLQEDYLSIIEEEENRDKARILLETAVRLYSKKVVQYQDEQRSCMLLVNENDVIVMLARTTVKKGLLMLSLNKHHIKFPLLGDLRKLVTLGAFGW